MSVEVSQIQTRIIHSGPWSESDTVVGINDRIVFTLLTDHPVAAPGYPYDGFNFSQPYLTLNNGGTATYLGVDAQGNAEFYYDVVQGQDVADLAVAGFRPGVTLVPKNLYLDKSQPIIGDVGIFDRRIIDDFNGDGKDDIFVLKDGQSATVYLSRGDGTFSESSQSIPANSGFSSVSVSATADINRDGITDLVGFAEDGKYLTYNLGRGDGTFADLQVSSTYTQQSGSSAFRLIDIDGDGYKDIAIGLQDGIIPIYGNESQVSFVSEGSFPDRSIGPVGDFNNDGIADLITYKGDYSTSIVEVRLGSEDGSFELVGNVRSSQYLAGIRTCDLNADGNLDLLVGGYYATSRGPRADSKILFGNGDGTFQVASQGVLDAFNATVPRYFEIADIDADGFEDIVTYGQSNYNGTSSYGPPAYDAVHVMRGRGDGTFEPARIFTTDYHPGGLVLADLDGDGKRDIITISSGTTPQTYTLSYLHNGSLDVPGQFDPTSVGTATGAQTGLRVDTTKPVFTGATITGPGLVAGTGTLTAGQVATITLTASEVLVVRNAGAMVLSLNDGGQAVYDAAASAGTQLVFRYTVAVDQVTPDLTVTGLVLNGASIWDEAGNEVVLAGAATNPAGTLRIDGYVGTPGNDVFRGHGGAETFRGLAGNDTYYVDSARDVVLEAVGEGDDTVVASVSYALRAGQEIERLQVDPAVGTVGLKLTGNAFAQTIVGGNGNDTLEGDVGPDVMRGGGGDDLYAVDDGADQVIEAVGGGGNDRIYATVSYTLAAGQEIEALRLLASTGTARLDLTGNEFAQTLSGNAGANVLDGKGGADVLIGGKGDDTYVVDNLGDQIVEAAGQGNDRVLASTSYALGSGQAIETMQLLEQSGTAQSFLRGNELAQTLLGNAADNVLDGKGGVDTMIGGAGNDTYAVDDARDSVREAVGGGYDTIIALTSYRLAAGQEVELVRLDRSTGQLNIDLTGNEFGQALRGGDGNNVLDGKGGADILTGGRGQDAFVFSTALGNGNVDRIVDFAPVDDTIRLAEDVFSAIGPGPLEANAFKNITTGKVDADDRILYRQATGELFYDADGAGNGAAVKFATLDGQPKLTHDDFFVV